MTRDEFSDIVLRQLDDVTAFAHYLTDAEWEAEELVQATYESAFERWETLDDPEQCRAWLFQIARNQWNDWLRSRRAGPELELVDPQDPERPRPTVDPKTVSQIDEKHVRSALDEVPEKYAEAIVLCDIWGFTYREIADIVDVPVGTIRSRISRGRSTLIDVLSRFESSDTSDPSSAE